MKRSKWRPAPAIKLLFVHLGGRLMESWARRLSHWIDLCCVGPSVCSLSRPFIWSLARSFGRPVGRSFARSLARQLTSRPQHAPLVGVSSRAPGIVTHCRRLAPDTIAQGRHLICSKLPPKWAPPGSHRASRIAHCAPPAARGLLRARERSAGRPAGMIGRPGAFCAPGRGANLGRRRRDELANTIQINSLREQN